ncbi:MAG: tetratricopeptide repeat protein [Mesorhizobium sp.]|nr:tetratricopeptide repeat protein [Mesorhizobium sp.]
MITDALGLELSGATAAAAAHYERGLRQLQTFTGDPVASADAAIAEAPDFVMARMLKAWLFGLSTDVAAMAVVRDELAAVRGLPMTAREAGHVRAAEALAAGGWNRAGALLAAVSADHPRDALALQAGHQVDFFTGNAPMLRDRVAAALPAWDAAMPGYHAMLSAHAFGLEETGDYAAAEREGRRAVELEPRDGWGQHAVAHVMEMQSRQADGIAWMRAAPENWSTESFLQVHNWWHLALFHYDLGDTDEIFSLYDGPIYGDRSTIALNMVDASALLWRLHLGGTDAGARWQPLADNWTPLATAGNYAFNDMHAMMAFAGAGRWSAIDTLLGTQREIMAAGGDNAGFTRDIGHPASLAIKAFAEGDYATTTKLLAPLRPIAHRFGGSHAQRDVIDLTLIEAAIRSGDAALATQLTTARAHARPDSPLSHLFVRRAEAVAAAG